jgi:hypothetical protein
MEELIFQNLGNISLAGALLGMVFVLRPWLMQREINASERDKRDHERELERLEIARQTATAISGLTNELAAGRAVSDLQIKSMGDLAELVKKMTEKIPGELDEIKRQIGNLPDKVWKTGDPKLRSMTDELKTCMDSDEIKSLLVQILERLKALEDKKQEKDKKENVESDG